MNPSLFIEFVERFFHSIVGSITEKWNGKREEQPLLHKTMLTEEYSADLTWGATELDHSVVAADVVALDSSLPLKKRDSLQTASGKLAKLGIKFRKGEKTITDINIMRARGTDENTIAAKVFDDVTKCVKGMDVRKEIMFLQGFSSGTLLVEDEDGVNDGVGIRVSFGYKDEHIAYKATNAWGDANATPISDLRTVLDAAEAEQITIGHVWLERKYFDAMRKSNEAKELSANYQGLVVTSTSKLPMPGRERMLEALRDEFGVEFHLLHPSFRIQKHDGTPVTATGWEDGAVVFTTSDRVGRLVYSTLAEETNPVAGVEYEKSGSHVLISKYSKTDPLEEFTAAQAICLPVIDGGGDIFVMHVNE